MVWENMATNNKKKDTGTWDVDFVKPYSDENYDLRKYEEVIRQVNDRFHYTNLIPKWILRKK